MIHWITYGAAQCALAVWLLALGTGAQAGTDCPGGSVSVEGAGADLAGRVCTIAADFRATFAACGLEPIKTVTVRVADVVDPETPNCAARFNCDTGALTILSPQALALVSEIDTPFATIPADTLFDSILWHELVHGLLHENAPDPVSRVSHEYLAHAVQIRALPADIRETFLTETPVEQPATASINMMVLRFVPAYFAAASWEYFARQDDICAATRQVIDGRTPFLEY